MQPRRPAVMIEALAAVAPGTALREGLDRILQANMGALVVLGDGPDVLALSSGGFLLDAEYTPQRLSELAKMDGAIVVTPDGGRIARGNVHLVPDPTVPTSETGTRHRTAERVARQLDIPVISVSEDMSIITVYRGRHKHRLEPTPSLLARASQALSTLERYKHRLDAVEGQLDALEVRDQVTMRDVALTLQRNEMVRRVADEIYDRIVELGNEGRLVVLQLDELVAGVADDRLLIVRDYAADGVFDHAEAGLAGMTDDELVELSLIARTLGHTGVDLDTPVEARGYRQLHKLPRLPETIVQAVVDRFGTLGKMLTATADELDAVGGVGAVRARGIRDGLARLAEANLA
ncbi:MAG: DNA integrity scanning diadenylate cyclase DisA [Acidimicrobiales bacterium]|nr:DNA integrity scanning diadenylate cyclase DisA [Acidimicrobiales bacterium]